MVYRGRKFVLVVFLVLLTVAFIMPLTHGSQELSLNEKFPEIELTGITSQKELTRMNLPDFEPKVMARVIEKENMMAAFGGIGETVIDNSHLLP